MGDNGSTLCLLFQFHFSRINLKCDTFAFLIGYYVTLRYHNSLKNIKLLFIQYRVPNVTEACLFDFSIFTDSVEKGVNCQIIQLIHRFHKHQGKKKWFNILRRKKANAEITDENVAAKTKNLFCSAMENSDNSCPFGLWIIRNEAVR